MTNSPELIISKVDYNKLLKLTSGIHTETSELLEDELTRAKVVAPEALPSDVVAMNSTVEFLDESSEKKTLVQLVYPDETDTESKDSIQRVSVLAPIGAALIGVGVGKSIDWPLPNGRIKRLLVVSVNHSTEAAT